MPFTAIYISNETCVTRDLRGCCALRHTLELLFSGDPRGVVATFTACLFAWSSFVPFAVHVLQMKIPRPGGLSAAQGICRNIDTSALEDPPVAMRDFLFQFMASSFRLSFSDAFQ